MALNLLARIMGVGAGTIQAARGHGAASFTALNTVAEYLERPNL